MKKNKKDKSALSVTSGKVMPEQVNQDAVARFRSNKKSIPDSEEIYTGIKSGNRAMLSKAITLVESSLPAHNNIAGEIIARCLPDSGNSIRIGITGVPGVGKSTFIETFGNFLTSLGKKIAVLAIDPSSEKSRGSILGDKTRMDKLSTNENAFIRPSPSSGSLGGVAMKTRESIILCEAAGYDIILVETVGVGQSETAVHSMVDFFLLLMLAGAGDELQGIKRGIMEMADLVAINKADGQNVEKARLALAEYRNALHLFPPAESGWAPQVVTCSSLEENGIKEIWELINLYSQQAEKSGYLEEKRRKQSLYWMYESVHDELKSQFYSDEGIKKLLPAFEYKVLNNQLNSFQAARMLMQEYFKKM